MKTPLTLSTLLLSILFSACEKIEKIEDFPLVAPSLVLNGTVEAGQPISVLLSRSLSVIDNANLSPVFNGRVGLFQNGMELETVEGPLYQFSTIAEAGKEYEIRASAPQYQNVSAATSIPSDVEVNIGEITVRELDSGAWGYLGDSSYFLSITDGQIELNILDNPDEENYYRISLEAQSPFSQSSPEGYAYASINSDPAVGERIADQVFIDDVLSNGSLIKLQVDFTAYFRANERVPYVINVVVSSLSRERYLYEQSYARFTENRNNPFADPVQVYNNINGGFGNFGGLSTVVYSKQL